MSSPVSIGDAILLAQIALTIGQAFTSGRKSAPAEFAEIQNLLFTLSESLKLLAHDLPSDDAAPTEEIEGDVDDETAVLSQIIMNCRCTLTYLEMLVQKYLVIETKQENSEGSRRWKDEMRRNWKKMVWTKEGGDIAKLKTTLTAHISGLNLAVSAINRRQGTAVKEKVETIHSKLDEIYQWFKMNMSGQNTNKSADSGECRASPETGGDMLTFELHSDLPSTGLQTLICPRASFGNGWFGKIQSSTAAAYIFQCRCCAKPHQTQLQFSCLPVSLFVQVPNAEKQAVWQLFVATGSSSSLASIYVSGIDLHNLRKYGEHVNHLATVQASDYLKQGISNMLISHSFDDKVTSVLDTKIEIGHFSDYLISSAFMANDRRFVIQNITSIHFLHYRSMPTSILRFDTTPSHAGAFIFHQPHAELILNSTPIGDSFDNSSGDHQYVVNIEFNTRVLRDSNTRIVNLHDVLCVSEGPQGNGTNIQHIICSYVEFEFQTTEASKIFTETIEVMKQSLFLSYLRSPRVGDQVVYQRFIGNIMIRDNYLADAHLSVVLDAMSEQYRLIIMSGDEIVSVCIELPPDFLDSVATEKTNAIKEYPAWFVRRTRDGSTITKQSADIRALMPERHEFDPVQSVAESSHDHDRIAIGMS